jgi:enoyl-CoA hydratase
MVSVITPTLRAWEHYPEITRIIIDGEGERAFCAGGDIRKVTEQGKSGQIESAIQFWADEYRLNTLIKTYKKPFIALVDGIVMGGGVGLSLHGHYRVAGDRYLFAMPEISIGLFPDVGATYALPRLQGETGLWLAVTGSRLNRADAMVLGLATHAVSSHDMDKVKQDLIAGSDIEKTLEHYKVDIHSASVPDLLPQINQLFDAADLPSLVSSLQQASPHSEFATQCLNAIRKGSPTSLAITFKQMRLGRELSFREAMMLEFRIVSRIMKAHDFYEGVRAVIIDKDHAPKWRPDRIEDLNEQDIEAYFKPLPEELNLSHE